MIARNRDYGEALRTATAHAPLTDTMARTLCAKWANPLSPLESVATGAWSAPLTVTQLALFLANAGSTFCGRAAATHELRSALCAWARRNTV